MERMIDMKTVGNVIWFILFGWEQVIIYGLLGVIMCMTIIGIPVGIALFQFAKLVCFPFGKEIVRTHEIKEVSSVARVGSVIANIIWFPFGLIMAITDIILAIACCITIIWIPVGIVYFRCAKFIIFPSGARVVTKEEAIIKQNIKNQSNNAPTPSKSVKNKQNNTTLNNIYQQQMLSAVFSKEEMTELGHIFTSEQAAKLIYFPKMDTEDDTWICSCGTKNNADFCIGCGSSRQDIFEKINTAYISEHTSARIAEENIQRAKEAEEKRKEREQRQSERREAIQKNKEDAINAFNNAKEACIPIKNKMAKNLRNIVKLFRGKWINKDFKVAVLAVFAVIILAITVLTLIFKASAIFVSLAIILAIIVLTLIFGDF